MLYWDRTRGVFGVSRGKGMKLNQKGFSLVELLIVLVIIGIIVAIVIPNMLDALDRSKQRATLSELHYWGTAVTAYHAERGSFPLPSGLVSGIYNQVVPYTISVLRTTDHWKHELHYETDAFGSDSYSIMSFGKDGLRPGPPFLDCTPLAWNDYNCDLRIVDGIFVAAP